MARNVRFALLLIALFATVMQSAPPATAQVADTAPVPTAVRVARAAVLRIESSWTYRPTFVAESKDGYGTGSGFLIDATGSVLTNAHVVNGGALEAFVDGSIEPIPARLVAIAECADLALLDLEGDGYPALTWASHPVERGDAVYALGYPDGAFDVVTTRGTVRSVAADNPTEWASIETAIRHTAQVEPGNSGGPLLDDKGEVVGVTYAEAVLGKRGFAIAARDVLPLLDRLAAGESIASIGVSGEAFYEDEDFNGYWVASVQEGSPAQTAGILPGDIVRAVGGQPATDDGSLGALCKTLRTMAPGQPLAIEVMRPDDSILLRGELYGAPLATAESIEPLALPTPRYEPTPTPVPTPRPDQFQVRTDETGLIALQVPQTWNFATSDPARLGSILIAPQVVLAQDERTYRSGRATPSVIAWVDPIYPDDDSDELASEVLNEIPCDLSSVDAFEGAGWFGRVRTWSACQEAGDPLYLAATLEPASGEPVRVSLLLYIPSGNPRFTLETLVAPLAANLLPAVPFWEPPHATVLASRLNVRTAPGLDAGIVTTLAAGEEIPVIGKDAEACEWVYFYFSNLQGWANASPEYLQLDRDCADLVIVTDETLEQIRTMVE